MTRRVTPAGSFCVWPQVLQRLGSGGALPEHSAALEHPCCGNPLTAAGLWQLWLGGALARDCRSCWWTATARLGPTGASVSDATPLRTFAVINSPSIDSRIRSPVRRHNSCLSLGGARAGPGRKGGSGASGPVASAFRRALRPSPVLRGTCYAGSLAGGDGKQGAITVLPRGTDPEPALEIRRVTLGADIGMVDSATANDA
jgi:hypothetical protein